MAYCKLGLKLVPAEKDDIHEPIGRSLSPCAHPSVDSYMTPDDVFKYLFSCGGAAVLTWNLGK